MAASVDRQGTDSGPIPIVGPSLRDPRLHTAAVILTVHAIGITSLGFEVSVPQVLVAIVVAGMIEIIVTRLRDRQWVWPASGMLTGSGVALILRHTDTSGGDYWAWQGWHWFALVAAGSILTKYLVKTRRGHIFNPSNIGLVVVFIFVGSDVLEPLDFWWAPLDLWMGLAYVVILGGGILITRGLRLLEMALVYWAVLATGLGVLVWSGHCMVATWSPTRICGGDFWWTLVTSPEILIFLLFMITDPKTIPLGRQGRVVFAGTLAIFSTMMIAPHRLEYGAKIGLLTSLAVWSVGRLFFGRIALSEDPDRSGLASLVAVLRRGTPALRLARGFALGIVVVLVSLVIVVAGTPSRDAALADSDTPPQVEVDTAALPPLEVDESVTEFALDIDDAMAAELAYMLAENLAIETRAILIFDESLLVFADGGDRLTEMEERVEEALISGLRTMDNHRFDRLLLRAIHAGGLEPADLVIDADGLVTQTVVAQDGAELSRTESTLHSSFVLRQLLGDRWLITDVVPR